VIYKMIQVQVSLVNTPTSVSARKLSFQESSRLISCVQYSPTRGHVVVTATGMSLLSAAPTDLLAIKNWLKKWRMIANESKSIHVTFATRREMCPPVHMNNVQLPKKKMLSILGYTLTGHLPGTNKFSQNGNN
jgi:hypothetical protein